MRKPVDEGGEVTYALIYSVLALADIDVGVGQPEGALKWLEDPKIGPMTLIAAKHPATKQGDFRIDAYKVAMRAYVGVQQVEKAEKAMDALEALVASGGDASNAEQLTRIYIALGHQLQELLERLRNENKLDQAEKAARAAEIFLTRISERKEGNTFNSLSWVAETFFGLGAGFSAGAKKLPPEAERYYRKAYETFLRILARCKENPKFAPQPGAVTSVKLRMAACARAMGEYEKAIGLLVGVLLERENRVDVQFEAAQTYQEWGKVKPACYLNAIAGGYEKNGRYVVWGWGGISAKLASSEKTSEKARALFHQARCNLAAARFELAQTQTGQERAATLGKAELDITRIYRLYPDMGGPEWYDKYDQLLKKIQKARSVTAAGLKGEARPAAKTP
jgi:tetratricopeptide (TPR) repeat protein